MDKTFTSEEIEQLANYRLSTELKDRSSKLSVRIEDLLDDDILLQFMQDTSKHIGSPNMKVTASMFSKRLAFLCAIYLYSMSAFNKKLNISLDKIFLQTDETDPIWLPTFYFEQLKVEIGGVERREWREEGLEDFFSNTISPLITKISKETKQSKLILWENIAIYIFWIYETILAQHENEEVRVRAKEDFHFLVQEAPGQLFGKHHENPIKRHYHDKTYVEHLGEEVRVRTTCCFYYLITDTSQRCRICPQTCNVKKKGE